MQWTAVIAAGFFFLLGLLLGAFWLGRGRERESASKPADESGPGSTLAALLAMQQRLEQYQAKLDGLDRERAGEQARLQQQAATLAAAGAQMTQEARSLRTALTTSNGVRGEWGEAVLENLLEACGLNANVDFVLQADLGAEPRLRPDAIVHLPSGRRLAVDAKASLAAFLEGREAADEAARRVCDARFAKVLRERARELSSREYTRHLPGSLPYVVMFVPSEAAFRAALDADPGLFLYGQNLQPAVLLASPSTLFPLLSVIAQGWRQHQASQDVRQLLAELQEFGARLRTFLAHVQRIGKGLDDAGRAFNAAVASYRSRLAPSAARIRDLGAGWTEQELHPVEHAPLPSPEAESVDEREPGLASGEGAPG